MQAVAVAAEGNEKKGRRGSAGEEGKGGDAVGPHHTL